MLTYLFCGLAIAFFVFAEAHILISRISIYEKLVSFVCFALIEAYYFLYIVEKMGILDKVH